MKKPFILFLPIILSAASITSWSGLVGPKPMNGIEIKTSVKVDGDELLLNGTGVRRFDWSGTEFMPYWSWIKPYVLALYVQSPDTDVHSPDTDSDYETRREKIFNKDEKKAMVLTVTSSWVTRENAINELQKGFDKSPDKDLLETEIYQFINALPDKIKEGDIYTIHYIPQTGTKLFRNKEEVPLTTITSNQSNFIKALVDIWINLRDPLDVELNQMLFHNGLKTSKKKYQ